MSIEISHLVVNGCSFTYCQGLDDPKTQGWPALLSNSLGIPVVNLAKKGSGNDGILRRTYEYHYKNKKKYPNSRPFYIFGFSHATRKEEYFKTFNGSILEDFKTIDFHYEESLSFANPETFYDPFYINKIVEYGYAMSIDYNNRERMKFLYWNSLVNLCKAEKIPYITADFFPTEDETIVQYMKTYFDEMYTTALGDINYVGRIPNMTSHIEKLPCGHESIQSMPIISDVFYKKMREVYKDIKVTDRSFLTTSELI